MDELTPEQRLWRAVIERALLDASGQIESTIGQRRPSDLRRTANGAERIQNQALAWRRYESFEIACSNAAFDAGAIERKICELDHSRRQALGSIRSGYVQMAAGADLDRPEPVCNSIRAPAATSAGSMDGGLRARPVAGSLPLGTHPQSA